MTYRLIRAVTAAVVLGIGAIAAYVSYRHALEVAQKHGETGANAYLTPLTVDGLVLVGSLVMLDAARRGVSAPPLARLALALGIGATVAVNVAHGIAHGPFGATIAAWPAITLVITAELLMGMIRTSRKQVATMLPEALPEVPGDEPEQPSEPHDEPEVDHDLDPVIVTARERFADVIAAGTAPSIRAIRRELHVGHPRAVRVRAVLAE